jgi:hypothetical protein
MILNAKQLAVADAKISMLKGRCDYLRRRIANPLEAQFARDEIGRMQQRIDELEEQRRLYLSLVSRGRRASTYQRLAEISAQLIERRLSLGWSTEQLGKAVGQPRQSIALYERTRYAGVSLRRLIQIDLALLAEEVRSQAHADA